VNHAPPLSDAGLRIRQLLAAADELAREEAAEAALRVAEDARRAAFDARPRTAADLRREVAALEAQELERLTHVRRADERELLERQAARLAADLQAGETAQANTRAALATIKARLGV
jgi:hypothetical protein